MDCRRRICKIFGGIPQSVSDVVRQIEVVCGAWMIRCRSIEIWRWQRWHVWVETGRLTKYVNDEWAWLFYSLNCRYSGTCGWRTSLTREVFSRACYDDADDVFLLLLIHLQFSWNSAKMSAHACYDAACLMVVIKKTENQKTLKTRRRVWGEKLRKDLKTENTN